MLTRVFSDKNRYDVDKMTQAWVTLTVDGWVGTFGTARRAKR